MMERPFPSSSRSITTLEVEGGDLILAVDATASVSTDRTQCDVWFKREPIWKVEERAQSQVTSGISGRGPEVEHLIYCDFW